VTIAMVLPEGDALIEAVKRRPARIVFGDNHEPEDVYDDP